MASGSTGWAGWVMVVVRWIDDEDENEDEEEDADDDDDDDDDDYDDDDDDEDDDDDDDDDADDADNVVSFFLWWGGSKQERWPRCFRVWVTLWEVLSSATWTWQRARPRSLQCAVDHSLGPFADTAWGSHPWLLLVHVPRPIAIAFHSF